MSLHWTSDDTVAHELGRPGPELAVLGGCQHCFGDHRDLSTALARATIPWMTLLLQMY